MSSFIEGSPEPIPDDAPVASILGIKNPVFFRPHRSTQKAHVILKRVRYTKEPTDDEVKYGIVYFSLFAQKKIEVKPGKEILLCMDPTDGVFGDQAVILAGIIDDPKYPDPVPNVPDDLPSPIEFPSSPVNIPPAAMMPLKLRQKWSQSFEGLKDEGEEVPQKPVYAEMGVQVVPPTVSVCVGNSLKYKSQDTQARPLAISRSIQVRPSTASHSIQAQHSSSSLGVQANPPYVSCGAQAIPSYTSQRIQALPAYKSSHAQAQPVLVSSASQARPTVNSHEVQACPSVSMTGSQASPNHHFATSQTEPLVETMSRQVQADFQPPIPPPVEQRSEAIQATPPEPPLIQRNSSSVQATPSSQSQSVQVRPSTAVHYVQAIPSSATQSIQAQPLIQSHSVQVTPSTAAHWVQAIAPSTTQSMQTQPSVQTHSVQATPTISTHSIQTTPSVSSSAVQAAPSLMVHSVQASPSTSVRSVQVVPTEIIRSAQAVQAAPPTTIHVAQAIQAIFPSTTHSVQATPHVDSTSIQVNPPVTTSSVQTTTYLHDQSTQTMPSISVLATPPGAFITEHRPSEHSPTITLIGPGRRAGIEASHSQSLISPKGKGKVIPQKSFPDAVAVETVETPLSASLQEPAHPPGKIPVPASILDDSMGATVSTSPKPYQAIGTSPSGNISSKLSVGSTARLASTSTDEAPPPPTTIARINSGSYSNPLGIRPSAAAVIQRNSSITSQNGEFAVESNAHRKPLTIGPSWGPTKTKSTSSASPAPSRPSKSPTSPRDVQQQTKNASSTTKQTPLHPTATPTTSSGSPSSGMPPSSQHLPKASLVTPGTQRESVADSSVSPSTTSTPALDPVPLATTAVIGKRKRALSPSASIGPPLPPTPTPTPTTVRKSSIPQHYPSSPSPSLPNPSQSPNHPLPPKPAWVSSEPQVPSSSRDPLDSTQRRSDVPPPSGSAPKTGRRSLSGPSPPQSAEDNPTSPRGDKSSIFTDASSAALSTSQKFEKGTLQQSGIPSPSSLQKPILQPPRAPRKSIPTGPAALSRPSGPSSFYGSTLDKVGQSPRTPTAIPGAVPRSPRKSGIPTGPAALSIASGPSSIYRAARVDKVVQSPESSTARQIALPRAPRKLGIPTGPAALSIASGPSNVLAATLPLTTQIPKVAPTQQPQQQRERYSPVPSTTTPPFRNSGDRDDRSLSPMSVDSSSSEEASGPSYPKPNVAELPNHMPVANMEVPSSKAKSPSSSIRGDHDRVHPSEAVPIAIPDAPRKNVSHDGTSDQATPTPTPNLPNQSQAIDSPAKRKLANATSPLFTTTTSPGPSSVGKHVVVVEEPAAKRRKSDIGMTTGVAISLEAPGEQPPGAVTPPVLVTTPVGRTSIVPPGPSTTTTAVAVAIPIGETKTTVPSTNPPPASVQRDDTNSTIPIPKTAPTPVTSVPPRPPRFITPQTVKIRAKPSTTSTTTTPSKSLITPRTIIASAAAGGSSGANRLARVVGTREGGSSTPSSTFLPILRRGGGGGGGVIVTPASVSIKVPQRRRKAPVMWPLNQGIYSRVVEKVSSPFSTTPIATGTLGNSEGGDGEGDGEGVEIKSVVFSSDGLYTAVCCMDQTIRIWHNRTRTETARLFHGSDIVDVAWLDGDAGLIVLSSKDGVVGKWTRGAQGMWKYDKLFDAVREIGVSIGCSGTMCLAFCRGRIAVSSPTQGLKVFMLKEGSWTLQRTVLRRNITSIKFIDEGMALIGGTKEGVLWHVQIPNGTLRAFAFMQVAIKALDSHTPTNEVLVTLSTGVSHLVKIGAGDGKGRIENTYSHPLINQNPQHEPPQPQQELQEQPQQQQQGFGAKFAAKGQAVVFGSVDGCALVWDTKKNSIVYALEHDEDDEIRSIAIFNGGHKARVGNMVSGTKKGELVWWFQPVSNIIPGINTTDHPPQKRIKLG